MPSLSEQIQTHPVIAPILALIAFLGGVFTIWYWFSSQPPIPTIYGSARDAVRSMTATTATLAIVSTLLICFSLWIGIVVATGAVKARRELGEVRSALDRLQKPQVTEPSRMALWKFFNSSFRPAWTPAVEMVRQIEQMWRTRRADETSHLLSVFQSQLLDDKLGAYNRLLVNLESPPSGMTDEKLQDEVFQVFVHYTWCRARVIDGQKNFDWPTKEWRGYALWKDLDDRLIKELRDVTWVNGMEPLRQRIGNDFREAQRADLR